MWSVCVSPDSDLLAKLRQSAENCISEGRCEAKNLMVFSDNQVLVWHTCEQCVYCFRLRDETNITNIQNLILTDAPLFDIESLDMNGTGRYLALTGSRGISVVELPAKWGTSGAYEGGKESVLCRSWALAQRFFVCDQDIELLCSGWHPTCLKQQHVVILTNDNCLRIFDIKEEEIPIQIINLSVADANATVTHIGVSKYASSLGEHAVSFDFGPSIPKCNDIDPSTVTSPDECLTPIYILRGNGDVVLVYSSLKYQYVSNTIFGPLTMRPPAEDNYGVDACSITCLDCMPPVIVIATSFGVIYHCVALDTDDKSDSNQSHLPEPTLYVYETIELSLSLATSPDMLDLSCKIRLHKDHMIPMRYFCSHACGLHVIAVPFVSQLKSTDETDFREDPSIVEHLVCTQPVVSSDSVDVPLGVSVGVQNGYTFVMLFLSSGELMIRRLTPSYVTHIMDSEANDGLESDPLSEVSIPKLDLMEYVKQLLKRNASIPLLKSKADASEDWHQNLQLLTTAIDVLQNEYIKKFDLASNVIEKRAKVLTNDKHIQLKELDKCMAEKEDLLQWLLDLVNKYDDTRERQEELTNRIDKILELLAFQRPELSEAELRLRDELSRVSEKLKAHNKKLEQIKVKHKYQSLQREQLNGKESSAGALGVYRSPVSSSGATGLPSGVPSPNQIKGIKEMLANQSEQIAQLVQSLNAFKTNGIE